MTAILKDDPPELIDSGRGIPPAIGRLVQHCLEKRPEDRFQSARDLAYALQPLDSGGITLLDTIVGTTREVRPRPRGQAVITGLAKAAKADVLAFVETRRGGDLWIMRRN